MPGLVRDAADLHVAAAGRAARAPAGRAPAATNARAAAAGSARAHQRLADERGIEARSRASGRRSPVSRTPDSATAIRSPGTSSRSRTARSGSTSSVRRSRLLIPTIRAPDASGGLELAGVVRLDERLQAEVARLADEPRQALRRVEDREQQDEVGPGSPEEVELPGVDDELLGEHRHGDRGPDGPEVVHRAAEPVGLAQDGDGRGATRCVGAGPRDGVVAPRRSRPPTASGA